MIGTRKRPYIAFEFPKEFHLDAVIFGGNEVALGYFEIARLKRGRFGKKLIARSCGEHGEICLVLFARNGKADTEAFRIHVCDARRNRFASGGNRAVEKQSIQNFARVNHDRMAHLKKRAMPAAGNELRCANNFLWIRRVEQEGICLNGLVGESAATGFFPCEALIVNGYAEASRGKTLSAESTGGASSNDCDTFHGPCQVIGKTAATNQAVSIAPKRAAAASEPVRRRNASETSPWAAENKANCTTRMGKRICPLARAKNATIHASQTSKRSARKTPNRVSLGLPDPTGPSTACSANRKMHANGSSSAKRVHLGALSQRSAISQFNQAPKASRSANASATAAIRSEEHTSELQSPVHLVCRLLLEKKK